MSESPYRMTIDLNVLNHLGINLYSNVPAVLSEAVANAWDADATTVDIDVDPDKGEIVIQDDGTGMTRDEVNERYLTVGYRRRKNQPTETEKRRPPMGRKGIGKLSLFSISGVIEVYTVRDGRRSAFRMDRVEIERQIEGREEGRYEPEALSEDLVEHKRGTRIVLRSLKKNLRMTSSYLRKRLARRFSILGAEHDFNIRIDGEAITLEDRDYFHKLEYAWWLDSETRKRLAGDCSKVKEENHEDLDGSVDMGADAATEFVQGWIGTARTSTDLQDDGETINRISLIVRGKLAQEDVLEQFGIGGVYSKYLIGEVHADFLDADELEDIATSSRQNIIETDPRYEYLKAYLGDALRKIGNQWINRRRTKGVDAASQTPAIKGWFEGLGPDERTRAAKLFGSINRLPIDDEKQRAELFGHTVLAFERFRHLKKLDALAEAVEEEQPAMLVRLFTDLDDIEATLYHRIVRDRLSVIEHLEGSVERNVVEKVVQEHLFNHLWLLDPSWERATGSAVMERTVLKALNSKGAKLTDEERKGRVDIAYRTTAGRHVIVELKRPERKMRFSEIYEQCQKYLGATRKALRQANSSYDPVVDVVCVLGEYPHGWDDAERREQDMNSLLPIRTRVLFYEELFDGAKAAYQEFIDQNSEVSRLQELLDKIARETSLSSSE